MEFKGTKGEWYLNHSNCTTQIRSMKNKRLICEVYHQFEIYDDDEDELNAKLIAAAPDLLEALQEMQIDLNILQSNFRQIEKVDSRAEGMFNIVQK